MKLSHSLKLSVLAGIYFLSVTNAEAQKAYVKLGGGYNFGLGSTIEYQPKTYPGYSGNGGPGGFTIFEPVNVTNGKGGVARGALGYMFNNNIGLELGVNYLAGAKNEFKKEDNLKSLGFGNINSPLAGVSGPTTTEIFTNKFQMLLLQPSVVITTGRPKLNPYTRLGLVAAKGILENTYSFSNSYGQTAETASKKYGGWGFGLQAALGLDINLNDKISIYTEGAFNYLTYSPKKGEVTKYNLNGNDLIPTLNTSQKEINYEDDYTPDPNASRSPSEPGTGQKQRFTMNSIGLNAGLKFNF